MNPARLWQGWKGLRLLLAVLLFGLAAATGVRPIVQTLSQAWQSRHWQPVPATVQDHRSGPNEDGEMAVWVLYRYEFRGRPHVASRLGTGPARPDNLGHWQADWAEKIAQAHATGSTLTAWVDPTAPHRALLDRSVRWQLLGFHAVPTALLALFGWVVGWAPIQPSHARRR